LSKKRSDIQTSFSTTPILQFRIWKLKGVIRTKFRKDHFTGGVKYEKGYPVFSQRTYVDPKTKGLNSPIYTFSSLVYW